MSPTPTIDAPTPSGTSQPEHSTSSIPSSSSSSTTPTPSQQPPWSVESALASFNLSPPLTTTPSPTTPIPTLHLLERLKTTPREGWRRFSVPHPESIADHMYRMSIITLLAPSSLRATVNISHATRLALVHDMAEAVVGDITPQEKMPKHEKARRERETMGFLAGTMLGGYEKGEQGKELVALWEEYEAGETAEAKFVKDVDKLELLCQMVEYEMVDPEKVKSGERDLWEFTHVAKEIKGEEMRGWADELMGERKRFWTELGKEARFA